MELRRPKTCPRCGSSKLVGILYGRPTEEGMEAVERGEYVLGSCLVSLDQPDWLCTACKHEWFDPEDPVRIRRDQILNDLINGTPGQDTGERS